MMKMHVDTAYRSLFKYGEELCGDNVRITRTEDSVFAVLADGLGSGVKANILSTLTSTIISTMLTEGAAMEQAVETADLQCEKACLFYLFRIADQGYGRGLFGGI